jgi:hypothetical protein
MNLSILASLTIYAASVLLLLRTLRSTRLSLGVPFAYLALLFIEHLPGAYAHLVRPDLFDTTSYVEDGVWKTSVGSMCFVAGVMIARSRQHVISRKLAHPSHVRAHLASPPLNKTFWLFCLFGGFIFVYGLTPLRSIPTLGAIVEKGGAVWILGVMLGLRDAISRRDIRSGVFWLLALSVYPLLTLIFGGFLSFGTIAAVVALSALVVSVRSLIKILLSIAIILPILLTVFVNYFLSRDQIRSTTWSSASFAERVDTISDVFSTIELLNLNNNLHANALHTRLNQNYFVGLAADRIDQGLVELRYGASFYDALIAIIPRALWPDKPVFGGSGTIVRDMTGLPLSMTTSWGVGQVMEFYINFGWYSLVLGFITLGWLIGRLDLHAAVAEQRGDARSLFVCFLPAVALTQPIISLIELSGGAFAAYLVAIGWSYAWSEWQSDRRRRLLRGE